MVGWLFEDEEKEEKRIVRRVIQNYFSIFIEGGIKMKCSRCTNEMSPFLANEDSETVPPRMVYICEKCKLEVAYDFKKELRINPIKVYKN